MLQPDRRGRLLQPQELRRADQRPALPQHRARHLRRRLGVGGAHRRRRQRPRRRRRRRRRRRPRRRLRRQRRHAQSSVDEPGRRPLRRGGAAARRGHRPGRGAQGRHGRARRRRRRRRRQRPAGDEPRHRVRLVLPQRRPLLRRCDQQRRPAHGEPPLHPLRHGARSTSTTTAGSTCTRPTAASGCRARPSPPTRTPSRTCCCAASTARRSRRCSRGAARRRRSSAPAGPPPSATSTTTAASTSWSPTATRRRRCCTTSSLRRGHWLLLAVRDARGSDALGAQLTIRAGGRALRRDVRTAYSYLAANDPRVHVGLGADDDRRAPSTSGGPTAPPNDFGPFDADRVVTVQRGTGNGRSRRGA